MPVEKFQDLVAWQKARVLTAEIYQLTTQGPFARDLVAGSDSASRSLGHVKYRGRFERGSRAEFHNSWSLQKAHALN